MLLTSDPKRACSHFRSDLVEAFNRVLESGHYILGNEVLEFEKEFAREIGLPNFVGVASGTDALEISIRALALPAGSGVLTTAHTATATIAAIERAGMKPILVDIDPRYYTICPNRLADTAKSWRAANRPVSAVVPVHLYGQPVDMDAINSIAAQFDLRVIEDCAQCHGAVYNDRPTGALGDASAFSFYPTKNLGAFGDGGGCSFKDAKDLERALLLRQYGWKERIAVMPGVNSRLDEVQAAFLRVALKHLGSGNSSRRRLADIYRKALSTSDLELPSERAHCIHVYHLFVIRAKQRDSLRSWLLQKNICASIHYAPPLHQQPAYEGRVMIGAGGLKETEKAAEEILSLPIFPNLTEGEVEAIADSIKEFPR